MLPLWTFAPRKSSSRRAFQRTTGLQNASIGRHDTRIRRHPARTSLALGLTFVEKTAPFAFEAGERAEADAADVDVQAEPQPEFFRNA